MTKPIAIILFLAVLLSTQSLHGEVEVRGDFEGSNIANVARESTDAFTCEMKPDHAEGQPDHNYYWFYLKVSGAAGRRITIRLTNCLWMPSHWDNYKPVCCYETDPNELKKHKWEKITDASRKGTVFSFTHTYKENTAWVALRYPFMYTYLERYAESIGKNPFVTVETAGSSKEGRKIHWIRVTGPENKKPKKGILVVAREHASEQDGSWVCKGMIDFLISNAPEATACREKAVFVFVPMLDPDASFHGRTRHLGSKADEIVHYIAVDLPRTQFKGGSFKYPESKSIWERKLQPWVKKGGTWDMCLYLHNPHGSEPNVWLWNGGPKSGERTKVNACVRKYLDSFTTREDSGRTFYTGALMNRLFGTVSLGYEINMHAKGRFLELDDYRRIGAAFVKGIRDYYRF